MRQLPCVFLIMVIVCSVFFVGGVRASTPVNGILTSNTTWTVAQSPIQLAGPVCVFNGATLTIEPGVTVDFGRYYLQVNGTLVARGTSDNKIYMTSTDTSSNPDQIQFYPSSTAWNEATSSGSIIENVVFNKIMIQAKGCSPKIANNVFNDPSSWMAIYGTGGGSLIITGNVIQGDLQEGISVGGSSVVTGNFFNTTGRGMATAIVAHENTYVANNKIMNYYIGVTADAHSTVTGNVIAYCSEAGIWSISPDVNIHNNYIMNCRVGLKAGGNIQSNTIINNNIGIQTASPFIQTTIKNNNIVGSNQSFTVQTSQDVDVTNNWWGTTDTAALNQSIWDRNDDFNLGTANYVPFLTAPDPSAPTSADIDLTAITTPPPPTSPTQEPTAPTSPTPTASNETTQPPLDQNPVTQPQPADANTPFNRTFYVVAVAIGIAVAVIILLAVVVYRSKDKPEP